MRTPQSTILSGKHIQLEPLGSHHIADLERVAEPSFWAHMGGGPFDEGGFTAYLQRADDDRDAGRRLVFAVVDLALGAAVGVTCFDDIAPEHERLEIGGTWYARTHWGGVTNPEAKLLLLTDAFDELGAARVALKTGHENVRSQSAIERLGATKEGVLRRHMVLPGGRRRDTVYYSMLVDEWPSIRAGLIARLASLPLS